MRISRAILLDRLSSYIMSHPRPENDGSESQYLRKKDGDIAK